MEDQCAQWLLGLSFGIHRNPLRCHFNPTELICSTAPVVEAAVWGHFNSFLIEKHANSESCEL